MTYDGETEEVEIAKTKTKFTKENARNADQEREQGVSFYAVSS